MGVLGGGGGSGSRVWEGEWEKSWRVSVRGGGGKVVRVRHPLNSFIYRLMRALQDLAFSDYLPEVRSIRDAL